MKRITIRVPEDIVRAYDEAEGNRSAMMRRALSDRVAEGELSGVPDDILQLAEAEAAKDEGRLARKRGTFRERCQSFFREKWQTGAVTPRDAEDMAVSWRREATIYGAEYVAFVEAITEWYAENWTVHEHERPAFPDPSLFIGRSDPEAIDVPERLVETMQEAKQDGLGRAETINRVSAFHPEARVERAAAEVWGRE